MSAYLTKEQIETIVATYGGAAKNTGATEVQIALFSTRIQAMSLHLKENRKDQSCKRALLTLVGKRKRLLAYLQNKDITSYRNILEKLGLRK
jgi:small subunit ribosomal protein S15